ALVLSVQAAATGGRLVADHAGTEVEHPAAPPGPRQGQLPPGRRTVGTSRAGIVRHGGETLGVVGAGGAASRAWVDDEQRWRLAVDAACVVLARLDGSVAAAALGPLHHAVTAAATPALSGPSLPFPV
ncbi:MAG: hypothetical protein H0W25_05380, partial [Acidimicrobiia bacterium]|nr:hypothetical protein [Acidimicrobiia bacterium]